VSLLNLAQALGEHAIGTAVQLSCVSNGMYAVRPGDAVNAAKTPASAAYRVIPQEYPNVTVRSIDVSRSEK